MEEWREIKDYEGLYEVSTLGRVRSFHKEEVGMVMCVYTHWKGYKFIYICKNGQRKKFFVHRLVACAFIPNPENHPIVNHKDLDKANNMLSNLEWCDESANMIHWRKMAEAIPDVDF